MIPEADLKAVREAVTFSAHLLSRLKRDQALEQRDRLACADVQKKLEEAERILYRE